MIMKTLTEDMHLQQLRRHKKMWVKEKNILLQQKQDEKQHNHTDV